MSCLTDEIEDIAPVTRLNKGFALRDLIAGAEFEIKDDVCLNDEGDEYEKSKFSSDEISNYVNINALDLNTDEKENVVSFSELRKLMDDLIPNGKVKKKILRAGVGDTVQANSVVYIHYSAYVNLDEIPFDNSYLRRSTPERYNLAARGLLPGLMIGLRTMKKGEKSQILIEPEYAFGVKGCPPRIPPEATVLYEVELFNFTDNSIPEETEETEIQDKQSFAYISKRAKSLHALGNDCFANNKVKAAIEKYKKAVDFLLSCRLKDEEEENNQKKILLKIYTNLSVCYIKVKQPERVCIVAREAVYIDAENARKNTKLLYNWGCALLILGDYKRSTEKLRAALKLEPNNKSIIDEITKLEKRKSQYAVEEKIRFQKFFGLEPKKNANTDSDDKNKTPKMKLDNDNTLLMEELREKIEEAKTGKCIEINLLPEVIERGEELCRSLITEKDSILIERKSNGIVISRIGDKKSEY